MMMMVVVVMHILRGREEGCGSASDLFATIDSIVLHYGLLLP
jgi:hypothetical protein